MDSDLPTPPAVVPRLWRAHIEAGPPEPRLIGISPPEPTSWYMTLKWKKASGASLDCAASLNVAVENVASKFADAWLNRGYSGGSFASDVVCLGAKPLDVPYGLFYWYEPCNVHESLPLPPPELNQAVVAQLLHALNYASHERMQ